MTISLARDPSLDGVFKNFFLAGTLKNRFLTSIIEPLFIPISLIDNISPAEMDTSLPKLASAVLLLKLTSETEAIEGSASPLNPKVLI